MQKGLYVVIIALIYSCGSERNYIYKSPTYSDEIEFSSIDISDLFRKPELYEGKNIEIKGMYSADVETHAVFKDKTTYNNFETQNAIWLTFDSMPEKVSSKLMSLDGKQVHVKGRYYKGMKGHLGIYNGELFGEYIEVIIKSD